MTKKSELNATVAEPDFKPMKYKVSHNLIKETIVTTATPIPE